MTDRIISLNHKLDILEEAGCKTVIKADIPEQKFMSDFDLTALLGNLYFILTK